MGQKLKRLYCFIRHLVCTVTDFLKQNTYFLQDTKAFFSHFGPCDVNAKWKRKSIKKLYIFHIWWHILLQMSHLHLTFYAHIENLQKVTKERYSF